MESIVNFLNSLLLFPSGGFTVWQIFLAILIAYFGGILSSLTPCVYPMIPITVSVVGGFSDSNRRQSWQTVLLRCLVYLFGMCMVYSFLGVLAGLTGHVFGSLTQSSSWYLVLGVVFTLAALMMFEVITVDPVVWLGRIRRKSKVSKDVETREITWIGAFVLGASSGLIAAPCTTPVLTAILAYITKTQSVVFGLALMLAFSIGLSTLLLLVAVFAGALKILPRSGRWMQAIKKLSGFILLALGEYLLYRAGVHGGLL